MDFSPVQLTPKAVERLLVSPGCLRGRIDARKIAAMDSGPGTDDYRVNMQKAAELERMLEEPS